MNPNQEHRFQYNLALLSAGSATVSVQQLVGSTYQTLATATTNSASGSYSFAFTPTSSNIRILVSSNTRFALNNLYLDRDHVDTLVETYALYAGGYRYGFQGQEKDDEVKGAGNSYTTEFRQYDPRISRWLSIDPLKDKFPWQSPYVAFDNNPIRNIDNDGRASQDIIVLLQRPIAGHRYGHQAILVGDDDEGWTYISLDGDADDGENNNTYTIQYFNTLEEFRNSEHNTFKRDYDDGKDLESSEFQFDENWNRIIIQRYVDAYRIKTSKEQDKKMIEKASSTARKGYAWRTNNCTYIPRDALRSVQLNDGEDDIKDNNGDSSTNGNYLPKAKQRAIELLNEGLDIDNEIKRD